MKKFLYVMLVLAMAGLLFAGTKVITPSIDNGPILKHGTSSGAWTYADGKFGPHRVPAQPTPPSTLPPVGRRPGSLDEVIISENFDAVTAGQLPTGWTRVDVDGGSTTHTLCPGLSVWEVWDNTANPGITAHSGSRFMRNHFNDAALPNNDWLILPQQTLTGTIQLSYWVASQDADYPDDYEVRVSTTGTAPANFTNLIFDQNSASTTWTQHTHDLSAYSGVPIYIAFHYDAIDEFIIKLDDVLLETVSFGGVEGTVTAAVGGAPIEGATVSVVGTALTTTTNASGYYVLGNVPTGTRSLSFAKPGYATLTVPGNTVLVGDTITVNAAMEVGLMTIISEGFESVALGALPLGWAQISVDAGQTPVIGGGASTWRVYNGMPTHGGSKFAACSYNSPAVPNNDWLILPRQSLSGTIRLRYWIASQDPDYRDSYEVRVSTTGNAPANFTNLIYDGNDIDTAMTEHTHDLSAYADEPFYIAFHYDANDEFVIKLDDVLLEATAQGPTGAAIVGTVTGPGDVPIPGVRVQVLTTEMDTVTAANGYYGFNFVDPATYSVMFTHPFYDTLVVENVVVTEDDTTTADAQLDLRDGVYVSEGTSEILDMDTASLSIDIADNTVIGDLDVVVNLTHTFDGDLILWLQSPLGETVMLAHRVGSGGDNFTNTFFDDEASVSITAVSAVPPYTGHFRPQEPLSAMDGLNLDGTWTLFVADTASGDEGVLESFAMVVTPPLANDEPLVTVPNTFAFHGNYPNPFNGQTTFQFSLAQQGNVALVLYNITGQEVARVIDNAPMTAGLHTVSYDAAHMASGVYFARLTAGTHISTRKIALLK